MSTRRGFLTSILAAGVAPAFIGSSVLMPVKKIIVPELKWWSGYTNFHLGHMLEQPWTPPELILIPADLGEIISECLRKNAPHIQANVQAHNALLRKMQQT